MRFLRAVASLMVAALVLTACSGTGDVKTRPSSPAPAPPATSSPTDEPDAPGAYDPLAGTDPELAAFYGQSASWEDCGTDLQCADITVPLDYENPNDGRTVRLHVGILGSAGDGKPGLFLNPGGPGGSGFGMLDWITYSVSSALASSYNMVGFDPRGVNTSDAVSCLTDQQWDERNAMWWDTDTQEGLDQYVVDSQAFVDACVENTPGDLLEFIDTDSAARDLDILRAVVGQKDTLDYLGYSYGTFLGAQYAELFPERVGAFVLDGAVDPALSMNEVALGQAAGFEYAIRAYMEDCLAGRSCPFSGTVDEGLDQLQNFFDVVKATPIPTEDPARPLGLSAAVSGVIIGLYESSLWGETSAALTMAMRDGDGSALLYWADMSVGRLEDGTYEDNSSDAFLAIDCLDYPVEGTMEDWLANADEMAEVTPFWGDSFAYTEVTCSMWPYQSTRTPAPVTASGAAPILVIGTTGDPATPYEWSVSLAEQLESGTLLTFEGNGHTAYGRSNSCINDAVDAFLIDGTVPEDGKTC